jgi:hypothetical protein
LFGEGDGGLFRWDTDDVAWLVVEVDLASVVDLSGKVKVPGGTVVHFGDRLSATEFLAPFAVGRAIIGGTATAGYGGTATAGYGGTATAGDGGTATAGENGCLLIQWYDHQRDAYRWTTGYIGENGLEAGIAYHLDAYGQIVPAAVTA